MPHQRKIRGGYDLWNHTSIRKTEQEEVNLTLKVDLSLLVSFSLSHLNNIFPRNTSAGLIFISLSVSAIVRTVMPIGVAQFSLRVQDAHVVA